MTEPRWNLSRAGSFWLLAALLTSLLFAASTPSPLYPVYQATWHFSPITLTAIYAVYAFAALAALLVFGRVSDHVGRRPVTVLALAVQIAGMLAFIAAQGVEALYVARVLQGFGTGLATGSISAWLLDLQPRDDRRLGSLVGGIAPVAGLALGAPGSSVLVQYGPDPLHLVFWLLTAFYALALVAMPAVPDPMERTPGWLRSLRPQIGVARAARTTFAASAPSLIATWAVAGLYLSLGPSLAISMLGSDSRIAGGLVIAALLGTGAIAAFLVRAADPRVVVIRGSLALIIGVAVTLFAVAMGSTVGLYAGSFIAGLGVGPAFSAVVRGVAPLAPPDKRGALLAAVYVVVYLSFSVPAIIAGVGVNLYGLRPTTYAYALVVMALAALTAVAFWRRPASAEGTASEAEGRRAREPGH
ncbi:MAG: MFS transporter [Chloroflexota bacterium]|nr:MFS transporter [Chloroflexota bacterium]